MTDAANDTNMGLKLERALAAAGKDEAARPEFYKMLMEAQVYVVGRAETEHEGEGVGAPHLHLKQWKQPDGTLAMPFFATMESFRDMFGFSEPHIQVSVTDLFRFAGKETTLVLNTIEGSKDFKQDEVVMLLNLVMDDPLTVALERAMQNREESLHLMLWNDFYDTLVRSRVFVLAKPTAGDEKVTAPRMVQNGESLTVSTWTHPDVDGAVAPFFSSQKILNQCVPAGESFLSIPALDFLQMATGFNRPLILNPGYKFNKMFAPQEVLDILEATKQQRKQQAK